MKTVARDAAIAYALIEEGNICTEVGNDLQDIGDFSAYDEKDIFTVFRCF
jgi:hypothetical protein